MNRIKWLLIFTFFLFQDMSLADETLRMAEEIDKIVTKEYFPKIKDVPFELNTQETDVVVALAALSEARGRAIENTIDRPCDQLVGNEEDKKSTSNKTKILFTVQYHSSDVDKYTKGYSGKLDFFGAINSIVGGGGFSSSGSYISNLTPENYLRINSTRGILEMINENSPELNVYSLSITDQSSAINGFLETMIGEQVDSSLIVESLAYDRLRDDPANWRESLSQSRDHLTTTQKINLSSVFGRDALIRYNQERMSGGSQTDGVVTTEQLLTSMVNNTPGGVCRDIALSQTQLLDELGIKAYVHAYSTLNAGHATVILANPDDPNHTIRLNYGYISDTFNKIGTSAITQSMNTPSVGLVNRFYDSKGAPVANTDTELGALLKDTAGLRKRDPLATNNHSIAKLSFEKGNLEGNIFTGKTSSGMSVVGATGKYKVDIGDYQKLTTGVTLSQSKSSDSHGTHSYINSTAFYDTNLDIKQDAVLGFVEYNAKRNKKFGDVTIEGEAGVNMLYHKGKAEINQTITYDSSFNSNSNRKGSVTDVQATGFTRLGADLEVDPDTKLGISYTENYFIDKSNIANTDGHSIAKDISIVDVHASKKLSDEVDMFLSVGEVMKKTGNSYYVRSTLQENRNNVTDSFYTSIIVPQDDKQERFIPGATKSYKVGASRKYASKDGSSWKFSVQYEERPEIDDKEYSMNVEYGF